MNSIANVIMVTSSRLPPPEEGIGVHVWELSKRLVDRGIRVTVASRNRTWSWSSVEQDGIRVVRVPFLPCYPFHVHLESVFVQRLANSLRRRTDIVHVHSPSVLPVVTRVPLVATCHTPLRVDAAHAEVLNLRSLAMKWFGLTLGVSIEKQLFRRAAVVAIVNENVRQEIIELGARSSSIVFVGNGVEDERFRPDSGPQRTSNGRTYRILYVGRVAPRKRPHDLLEAVAVLKRQGRDVCLEVAGTGPLGDSLRTAARRLGLSSSVRFLGHIPHWDDALPALYRQADIFVQPSAYEGLPGTLLEAMASGAAVVATDIPAHRAVITHGENGWLVPPCNPQRLAAGLSILLDDSSLRAKLGRAARETVQERYTWDRVTDAVLDAYALAGTHHRSSPD